jgi:glycosyltransferase 2 family protein
MGITPQDVAAVVPAAPRTRFWQVAASWGLALGSLIWVFHDLSFGELWVGVHGVHLGWIFAAVSSDTLAYACQGWRWSLMLRPAGNVGTVEATKAIYAGLYVNEVLPLRLGELLRIYVISRRLKGAVSIVVSSAIVERFIDAVWLAAAFGVVVLVSPLPHFLVDAEEFLTAIVLGGLAVFVLLAVLSKRRAERGLPPSRNRLLRAFRPLGDGLVVIGRSSRFPQAFVVSAGVLAFQGFAFYFVALSYGIRLSFWQISGAFLVTHVGNVIPSGPGNLGTYQLFTVLGLTLFGVDKTTAGGFSIVVFLILTIPLWAIGFFCFARAGLELRSVKKELADWLNRNEHSGPGSHFRAKPPRVH